MCINRRAQAVPGTINNRLATGIPRNPFLSKVRKVPITTWLSLLRTYSYTRRMCAQAAYPITHGNSFCSDAVGVRSIESAEEARFEYLDLPGLVACPITLGE